MDWLSELFTAPSVMHVILVLGLVVAVGLALGQVRLFGVSVGVAGVLFAGLLAGHWLSASLPAEVLGFARDLGLILFVYTVGLQVGPGFFASFHKDGLGVNLAAAAVAVLGAGVAVALHVLQHLPVPVTLGLLSGAVTNTPSLAAAQQALQGRLDLAADAGQMVSLGYAIAYPFGVLGTILTMALIGRCFRLNAPREAAAYDTSQTRSALTPNNLNVEVENPQLAGQPVSVLAGLIQPPVVISRLLRGDRVQVARPTTLLQAGDVLHAVGARAGLDKLRLAVGDPVAIDLRRISSALTTRAILVTQREVVGRSLAELDLGARYDVAITRLARSGVEFVPKPTMRLQLGDRLTVVGEEGPLKKVSVELGDSPKALNRPDILPVCLGIAAGIIVGGIPLPLPGAPGPLHLGLAGGPLVVALLLSRLGRIGPVMWFMPENANHFVREMGIALFLACVGLRAGASFVPMLARAEGWCWLGYGAAITLVPLLAVALAARLIWKMNYGVLCGLLAGSMTDPPALAFATAHHPSEAPMVTYAAVYPLAICLRVFLAQLLALSLP